MTDISSLNALLIDPQRCTVESVMVEPGAVPALIGTERTSTVEYSGEHCLVLDDGTHEMEHPARFRFMGKTIDRPFFGPVVVLGSAHGNWISATLTPKEVKDRIIWEHWDSDVQTYAAAQPLKS